MTDIAIGNQVTQMIGFFITLNSIFTKRNEVVNVKLATRFGFRDTATPTGEVVTLSSQSSLFSPVWAVVRGIATAPIEIIFTGYKSVVKSLPFDLASLFAKHAALCVGLLDRKGIVTLGANFTNSPSTFGIFASDFWTGNTLSSPGKVFAKALLIAKVKFGFIDLRLTPPKGSAALITRYLNDYTLSVFAQVFNDATSSIAFLRAVDSRPASMIPELLAAFRAIGPSTRGSALALTGAMYFRGRRVIAEGLITLRANLSNHLVSLPSCI